MAEERIYTIPLRKEFLKAPNYKRTKRAVTAVRSFIKRHMKTDDVKIGSKLNLELWKHGRKNPPARIKVHTMKEGNIAKVELIDIPFETSKKEEDKKSKKEEKKEVKQDKKPEEPKEKKVEKTDKKEKIKPKEEIKKEKKTNKKD